MQNGRSIHTGATINVARNFDWDDDGYPNAVPYYMSSNGYGVLRNTFAAGSYDFAAHTTTHAEQRFDAYYFVGDYTDALDSYTKLTGRPMMPPVYALEYGDADCYNRSSPTYSGSKDPAKLRTPQALEIAKDFVENDMPAGWMLVNDGYGCEYQELPETVDAIEAETGLKTGLWTQRSLTQQEYEVGEAGVRLRKLDVAWVGSGYRLALTGCEAAHDGIEQYSDARGTSLMVEGWAGSQRCGMQWTGDHSGNLDAVRWQVSALTGAGNSGMPFTTGDVDGIFGGSAESYVRDLQWKAFAPALYSMSGWASTDKRPWLYGEQATAINRSYLQLRQQLMPYIYSLAAESHRSGLPMMRSIALEYPNDPGAYSVEANNEFLLGGDYLVAPVFTKSTVRNGIYLPAGDQWVDYWTGTLYEGGQVVNGHPAPLEQLPIFVRAGAVVPQGITARNASLVPEDSPITLSVYPQGDSEFSLYEDDKVTRGYADGESSTQEFIVTAPDAGKKGTVTVEIGERDGEYAGKAAARPYRHRGAHGLRAEERRGRRRDAAQAGLARRARGRVIGLVLRRRRCRRRRHRQARARRLGRPGRGRARRHEQRGRPRSGCRRGIRRRRPRRPRVPGRADHGLGDLPQHGHEGEGRRRADGRRARGLDARLGDRRSRRHGERRWLGERRVRVRGDGCLGRRPADGHGRGGVHLEGRPEHGVGGEPALRRLRFARGRLQRRLDHRDRDRRCRRLRRRRGHLLGRGARPRRRHPRIDGHRRHRRRRDRVHVAGTRRRRRLGLARGPDHRTVRAGHAPRVARLGGVGRWREPRARTALHRRHHVDAERVLPELAAAGLGPRRSERRDQVARAQQCDEPRGVRVSDVRVPGVLEPRAAEPREGARVRGAAHREPVEDLRLAGRRAAAADAAERRRCGRRSCSG